MTVVSVPTGSPYEVLIGSGLLDTLGQQAASLLKGRSVCIVSDDMVAGELGMKVFLLTDCLINKDNADVGAYPNGGFDELCEFISAL